jgi:hypothetical protein
MLRKKEIIYRHLLGCYFEKRETRFTQLGLSKKFSISLSTVSNALAPLRSIGAVSVLPRSFVIADARKFLLFWATSRRFERDVIYRTRYDGSVTEAEKSMSSETVFTAYSAYRMLYGDAPADYSEVYAYACRENIDGLKRRFPPKDGPPNIIILEADQFLGKGVVSPPQMFVDLWNLRSWYAKAFVDALEKRLFG